MQNKAIEKFLREAMGHIHRKYYDGYFTDYRGEQRISIDQTIQNIEKSSVFNSGYHFYFMFNGTVVPVTFRFDLSGDTNWLVMEVSTGALYSEKTPRRRMKVEIVWGKRIESSSSLVRRRELTSITLDLPTIESKLGEIHAAAVRMSELIIERDRAEKESKQNLIDRQEKQLVSMERLTKEFSHIPHCRIERFPSVRESERTRIQMSFRDSVDSNKVCLYIFLSPDGQFEQATIFNGSMSAHLVEQLLSIATS